MHCVTDFVDGLFLLLPQRAVRQEGILFKEEPNLVTRPQEIIVRNPRLLVSRKDRDGLLRIELLHQLLGPLAQTVAVVSSDEAFEDQVPITTILRELFA
jgi:hypothetical protein